jgi:putative transposase
MARLPRLVVPGLAHYLILRGHSGLGPPGICSDAIDRAALTDAMRESAAQEGVQLHAYAMLHDELQLLATPEQPTSLGRLVQALGRRYVSAYNRRHQRRGTLWEGRFRCAVVEPGDMRLTVLLLIDGLSNEPGITSASHRDGGRRDSGLIDPPEVWQLGNTPFEREAAYRQRLATGLPGAVTEPMRRAALGGWALGASAFVANLAEQGNRPPSPRPRGRPRRAAG